MKTIADFLAELPLTEGLSPAQLELIAGCGRNVLLQPGDYALREGEPADTFYALRSGRVALEIYTPKQQALTLQTVGAGEVLGWSWLFPPYTNTVDARVVETTRAVAFDGACLRGKAERDHELGYQLMHRIARVFTQRLSATRLQLLDVYGASHAR